jgi:hypothetical protein
MGSGAEKKSDIHESIVDSYDKHGAGSLELGRRDVARDVALRAGGRVGRGHA